jgi:hypothetical protein
VTQIWLHPDRRSVAMRNATKRVGQAFLAALVTLLATACSPPSSSPNVPTSACVPTIGSAGCAVGQYPDGAWRPYSPFSIFNIEYLPGGVDVDPSTTRIIPNLGRLNSDTTKPNTPSKQTFPENISVSRNGHAGWPTYYATASDPLIAVTCYPIGACPQPSSSTCPPPQPAQGACVLVHIPANAKPQFVFDTTKLPH